MPRKTMSEYEKSFNLEDQYQFCLLKLGLKESNMSPVERVERKRIFMAACSQMIIIFTQGLSSLPEDKAINKIQELIDESMTYWIKDSESGREVNYKSWN